MIFLLVSLGMLGAGMNAQIKIVGAASVVGPSSVTPPTSAAVLSWTAMTNGQWTGMVNTQWNTMTN